jgi:hypothetical protein
MSMATGYTGVDGRACGIERWLWALCVLDYPWAMADDFELTYYQHLCGSDADKLAALEAYVSLLVTKTSTMVSRPSPWTRRLLLPVVSCVIS